MALARGLEGLGQKRVKDIQNEKLRSQDTVFGHIEKKLKERLFVVSRITDSSMESDLASFRTETR
jgi:hypothetical protein